MQPNLRPQRDLFEEERKSRDIPPALRSTLVRLVESLLVEALADHTSSETSAPMPETTEAAHEQDHA